MLRWLNVLVILGLLLSGGVPVAAAGQAASPDTAIVQGETTAAQNGTQSQAQAVATPAPAPGLADVSLTLEAPQEHIAPGSAAPITLLVQNTSKTAVEGLSVELFFDAAQMQVVGKVEGATIEEDVVRWTGVAIKAGASWQQVLTLQVARQYSLRATLTARVQGEELYATRHSQALLTIMDPPPVTVRVVPGQAQTLTALGGRVTLEMPADAVREPLTVQMQWSRPQPRDPAYVAERFRFTALNGKGEMVTHFAAPLRLRVQRRLQPAGVAMDARASQEPVAGEPTFYWLDESKGAWVDIGGTYDRDTGELVVAIDHFSVLGVGEADTYGDVGLPDLKVNAASLFAGDFSFSYLLAMPPGPHGLGPKLALTYSDEVANSAWRADVASPKHYTRQASLTGYGWNLGGLGKIAVDWKCADKSDVHTGGCVQLSFPGGSYTLKYVDGVWHTEPESFLKIEHGPLVNLGGLEPITNWTVWDQDGTSYVFGNGDGSQAGTAYFGRTNANCERNAYAYYLTDVKDVHGNEWQVQYTREKRTSSCEYVKATYPSLVKMYAIDAQGGGSKHAFGEVQFYTESREDYKVYKWNDNYKQTLYADQRINKIVVRSDDESGAQDIFTYDLGYEYTDPVYSGNECDVNSVCKHSLLNAITIAPAHNPGGNYSVSARATTFAYDIDTARFAAQFLKSVENGHGGQLYLVRDGTPNAFGRWTLQASRVYAGGDQYGWTTYGYESGGYDGADFAGFATVTAHLHPLTQSSATTPPAHSASDVLSRTHYRFYQGILDGQYTLEDALRGKQKFLDRYQGQSDGVIYERQKWVYQATIRSSYTGWAKLFRTIHQVEANQPEPQHQWQCSEYTYDENYGVVIDQKDFHHWCAEPDSQLYRTSSMSYAIDVGTNLVRLATRRVNDSNGVCRQRKEYYYYAGNDYAGSAEAPLNQVGLRGLLRRARTATDTDGDCGVVSSWAETEHDYYADGDPKRTTQPPNHAGVRAWMETTWDSVHGTYVVAVTNNLGQSSSTQYDLALGVALSVTDVNGVTNEFEYDGYGRLRKSWIEPQDKNSGDTRPTQQIEYYEGTTTTNAACSSSWCLEKQQLDEVGGDNYLHSYTFRDGLGRVLQTQAEGEGQHIVTDTWYDANGQVEKQSVPYFVSASFGTYHDPAAQPASQYVYDGLGRVTVVTAADGTQTKRAYQGYKTAVIDANSHMTMQEQDDWGRLEYARQYQGTYTAANWGVTAYFTATYSYDAVDNLTMVADSSQITTTIAYDLAGRKKSMDDPDMGAWNYTYDDAGNLRTQTDARGVTLCFEYDMLNRKVYVRQDTSGLDCVRGLNWRASYVYDQGTNGIGRRTSMDDSSGSSSWVYDDRGRVITETKEISGGGTFTTTYGYDGMDRVAKMTYPDGEEVTYSYNAQGLLYGFNGAHTYVASTTYDEAGRVDVRTLGKGSIDFNYYPWDQTGPWSQDPNKSTKGGALSEIHASVGSTELLGLHYFYDVVGNIEHINDWRSGVWENHDFSYDDLNRLLTAGANSNTYNSYSDAYTYHANGNIDTKNGQTYDYAGNHPHAASSAQGNSYGYDANGNMTSRTVGGVNYALTYDAENHLISVSSGGASASYVYDGDGKRVKTVINGVTTVYIGKHYEQTLGSGYTKYYFAGSDLVAFERSSGYGQDYGLRYVFRDHLGGTAVIINGGGAKLWEDRYKAYGDVYDTYRKDQGGRLIDEQTAYRYTGQRFDAGIGADAQNGLDRGLYFYNSRYYDPTLGRFIQPDTIVPNPGNPQSLNRYAYAANNPVRYRDPSGHGYCEDLDCVVKTDVRTGHLAGLGDKWGISMTGPWEAEKEWMVYEGMRTISERVGEHLKSSKVAVSGDDWVRKNAGGTTFERWPNDKPFIFDDGVNHIEFPIHPAITLFRLVYKGRYTGPTGFSAPQLGDLFPTPTIHFFDEMDETTPVHEVGHILDYRSQSASSQMSQLVVLGKSPSVYGKGNRLEDFAESWRYWLYDLKGLTSDRKNFIESLVVQRSR